MATRLKHRFWHIVFTLVIIYGVVRWGIPAASRYITEMPFPLPVPGTLMLFYMTLTLVALFLFVTYSDENLNDFMRPVNTFLRGGYTKTVRFLGLVTISVLAGWQVYGSTIPKLDLPSSLRIQHPSSNFPKTFEKMSNPFGNPTEAQVGSFVKQARAGKLRFIEQANQDIDAWREEHGDDHPLAFIASAPWKQFLTQLNAGNVDQEVGRLALLEKNLFEGRVLYAMNCRPCHGDSVAGDGPMADGFKLRPLNFTDNGTIETIVEGYTFWRVSNGGPGLPTEATPWDSAMPEWKLNLTEEERWKIILAEYDLAEKTPRIPESH